MRETFVDNIPLIMMITVLIGFPIAAPILMIIMRPIVNSYNKWLEKFAEGYYRSLDRYYPEEDT